MIVTCLSEHSRNRKAGIIIGEGGTVKEAREKIGMTREAIDNIETPMLMHEGEKNVVKKALQMYIDKLEMESYDK